MLIDLMLKMFTHFTYVQSHNSISFIYEQDKRHVFLVKVLPCEFSQILFVVSNSSEVFSSSNDRYIHYISEMKS